MQKLRDNKGIAIALFISSCGLFFFLDSVPGLHGDEAWIGVRVYQITAGSHSLQGMNFYTGSLYQYLELPILKSFGYNVFALRLLTAILWQVALIFYYGVIKRGFGAPIASLSSLLLVTMPFFIGFGRLAGENFALNPVLSLSAVYLLISSNVQERNFQWKSFAAGALLGLGIWNHFIFISVALTFIVFLLFSIRKMRLSLSTLLPLLAGLMLGAAPVLIFLLVSLSTHGGSEFNPIAQNLRWTLIMGRLIEWPTIFLQIIHGDVIFQRYAGEVRCPTLGLSQFLLGCSLGGSIILLLTRKESNRDFGRVLSCFLILFFLTLCICPSNSDRYFLLPLFFAPFFIAYFWNRLLAPLLGKKSSLALIALFVCLQVTRISINYFADQLEFHGRPSFFTLGSMEETSNHFIDTKDLYQTLVDLDATEVVANFFIASPLEFLDLEKKALVVKKISTLSLVTPGRPGRFLVGYSNTMLSTDLLVEKGYRLLQDDGIFSIFESDQSIANDNNK